MIFFIFLSLNFIRTTSLHCRRGLHTTLPVPTSMHHRWGWHTILPHAPTSMHHRWGWDTTLPHAPISLHRWGWHMVISHVDWCIDGLYSVLVVKIIMRHRVSICLCLPFFFTLSRRSRPVHLNGPASTLSDLFHSDFPVFNFASMRTTFSLTSPQCEQRYL